MSNRQQKQARAKAFKVASNQKLWQQGKAALLSQKWYYPIKYKLSKKFRAAVDKALGVWYRANLKDMADQAIANINDPDRREMARAQKRMRKAQRRKEEREYRAAFEKLQLEVAQQRLKDLDEGKGAIGSNLGEFMKEE